MRTLLVATVLLTLGLAAAAPATTGSAVRFTGKGVGDVQLGDRFRVLRDAGLVGPLKPGCELAVPFSLAERCPGPARLKGTAKGFVDLTRTTPRRVRSITLSGGARARGVGIGSTIRQIRAAFPGAKVDHGTDDTLGVTLVKVPRSKGGRFHFGVSTMTKKTTVIGIPTIAFCE